MSKHPRIAIPLPTSRDLAYNRECLPQYFAAIELSGGEPVPVSLDGSARQVVSTCSAVVLPGSPADVNPARYGQASELLTAPADEPRETTDAALLESAEHRKLPVLGICYGLQSINVWRGGSLLQDLTRFPVNHAAGPSVAVAHTAAFTAPGLLQSLLDQGESPEVDGSHRLPVNSSHHQAIGVVGEGLRIVARCPQDGIAEAIESSTDAEPLLFAVQWHPERSYAMSATSRALFARLVARAGA